MYAEEEEAPEEDQIDEKYHTEKEEEQPDPVVEDKDKLNQVFPSMLIIIIMHVFKVNKRIQSFPFRERKKAHGASQILETRTAYFMSE